MILPLIERGGTCILLPGSEVLGVLLKYPETGSQFNHTTGCYQALVDASNAVAQVFHTDVLSCLVAVGALMYLRLDSYVPSRTGKFIAVRINVPNVSEPVQGKIYVSALRRNLPGRNGAASTSRGSVTLEVNPWDLTPEGLWAGDRNAVDKWLQ